MLRLDRMRAPVDVCPGVEREDEMVAAFDYCQHGIGGAAPSRDLVATRTATLGAPSLALPLGSASTLHG